jgi:hypothetical protein
LALLLQQQWHNYWRDHGVPNDVECVDLQELREKILKLTLAMVKQIAKASDELNERENHALLKEIINEKINIPFITIKQKAAILQSLLNIGG